MRHRLRFVPCVPPLESRLALSGLGATAPDVLPAAPILRDPRDFNPMDPILLGPPDDGPFGGPDSDLIPPAEILYNDPGPNALKLLDDSGTPVWVDPPLWYVTLTRSVSDTLTPTTDPLMMLPPPPGLPTVALPPVTAPDPWYVQAWDWMKSGPPESVTYTAEPDHGMPVTVLFDPLTTAPFLPTGP